MTFHYTEQHGIDYRTDGLTILRGLIPPALLTDLRRETDKACEIARLKHGPQAQRLQPVWTYDELNLQLFRDFLGLPGMRATVEAILGPEHQPSERMAVFLEPERDAWCTAWHRDWGNVPGVDLEAFFRTAADLRMYNQLNAALYDDHSLHLYASLGFEIYGYERHALKIGDNYVDEAHDMLWITPASIGKKQANGDDFGINEVQIRV